MTTAAPAMRIVLLGPPGAGKGTQARILEERFDARQISTGDILRKHRVEKTALGTEAQAYMDRGALVPDDLVIRMMEGELAGRSSFILDGFPRTVTQADALAALLARLNLPLQATVLVDVPRPELIARLTGRWSNPRTGRSYHALYDPPKRPAIDDDDGGPLVQRSDDSLEVVTNRLETYDAQTQPLVEYYERAGLLARIDGMQPVETVTERIVQSLADRPGVPR